MTGYGKGAAPLGGGELLAEVRTVNHRFLEISTRTPRSLSGLERDIEKLVKGKIRRGHVYITISFSGDFEASNFSVNRAFLEKAYRELSGFARKAGIPGDIDIKTLLSLPEALSGDEQAKVDDRMKSALEKAVLQALGRCAEMRNNEGAELAGDMRGRLAEIEKVTARIEKKAPAALKKSLAKAKKRLSQLVDHASVDSDRWMTEAAIMADKSDFSEELVRLKSHLAQFSSILDKGGEVSKKLTFLLQEIHREATTMGNKATDAAIITQCLSVKEKAEKIREQVQNLE